MMHNKKEEKIEKFTGDSSVDYSINKKYVWTIIGLFVALTTSYIGINLFIYFIENFSFLLCLFKSMGKKNTKNKSSPQKTQEPKIPSAIDNFCGQESGKFFNGIKTFNFVQYTKLTNNRRNKLFFLLLMGICIITSYFVLDHTVNHISLSNLFSQGGYFISIGVLGFSFIAAFFISKLTNNVSIFEKSSYILQLLIGIGLMYNLIKLLSYSMTMNNNIGYEAVSIMLMFFGLIFFIIPKFSSGYGASFLALVLFGCLPILGHLYINDIFTFGGKYLGYGFLLLLVLYLPTLISHYRS